MSERRSKKAAPAEKRRGEAALERFHEEAAVKVYDAKNLRRLWPFVKPHGRGLIGSLLLLLLISPIALARPLIMRMGLDKAANGDSGAIFFAGIFLTVAVVVEQGIAFPQMYLMQVSGARAMADLRRHVFAFLHTRNLKYFDRTPVGRLVTRVTNDVDAIGEVFGSGALNALGDMVRLLLIVGVMLSLNARMALIAFAALPPVLFGVNYTRKRIRDAFREVRTKTARMNSYLNEQVSGMALVQAYAREAAGASEFDAINTSYRDANNRSIVWDATLDAAIELISSVCIASVLWAAGLDFGVSFGTLFAFVAYIDMFFTPIRDLTARYTVLQSAMTGAERVFELLDNPDEDAPRATDSDPRAKPDPKAPILELDHVTFGYKPDVDVLKDVSLSVTRGERIALVGATGAGKSTVASLFLRLYDVTRGDVRVQGVRVQDWEREALRANFAVVPQDVFLFPGTVATNIAAGDAEPDMDRVVRALARIGALEMFSEREGGLEARVVERGSNFSAGERQLIAFARALYKDPSVLILDEATASVDSDTEARLQRAIESILEGRTSLVIAHRLSTIRSADRIVVFHKGRIVEQGSHEELLASDGVYARLHKLQFAKTVVETGEAKPQGSPASAVTSSP
ncbi:MAG: ABC transporter ATP-binding protein [Polyangiaceae bacterium]